MYSTNSRYISDYNVMKDSDRIKERYRNIYLVNELGLQ